MHAQPMKRDRVLLPQVRQNLPRPIAVTGLPGHVVLGVDFESISAVEQGRVVLATKPDSDAQVFAG